MLYSMLSPTRHREVAVVRIRRATKVHNMDRMVAAIAVQILDRATGDKALHRLRVGQVIAESWRIQDGP